MLSLEAYLKAIAPSVYASEQQRGAVEAFYPLAQEIHNKAQWGEFTNRAVVLWSLHNWAYNVKQTDVSARGPTTSSQSGDMAKESWADPLGGQGMKLDYQATKYGQQYVTLKAQAMGAYAFGVMGPGGRGVLC